MSPRAPRSSKRPEPVEEFQVGAPAAWKAAHLCYHREEGLRCRGLTIGFEECYASAAWASCTAAQLRSGTDAALIPRSLRRPRPADEPHAPPSPSCTCGFHAYHARARAEAELERSTRPLVVLEVEVAGSALQYPSGWRFAHQRLRRLSLPGCRACPGGSTLPLTGVVAFFDSAGFDASWRHFPFPREALCYPTCARHAPADGRAVHLGLDELRAGLQVEIELPLPRPRRWFPRRDPRPLGFELPLPQPTRADRSLFCLLLQRPRLLALLQRSRFDELLAADCLQVCASARARDWREHEGLLRALADALPDAERAALLQRSPLARSQLG